MVELSKEQVDYILSDIKSNGIVNEDLQYNLLDHICCLLERELSDPSEFEAHYPKVLPRFFKRELVEIQEETDLLLTFKNYYAMKRVMLTSGIASAGLFTIGALFKALQIPGASIVLVLGMVILSFVFFPVLFTLKFKEEKEKRSRITLAVATVFGILISLSVMFKLMHWPGANMMWLVALGILFFLFLPLHFFSGIRKPESKTNTIVSSILVLVTCGMLFSLSNLRPSHRYTGAKELSDEAFMTTSQFGQIASELSSRTPEEKASLTKAIENVQEQLLAVKSTLIAEAKGENLSELQLLEREKNNYLLGNRSLYNEQGEAKDVLLNFKSAVKDLGAMLPEKLAQLPMYNTNDHPLFGHATAHDTTWEDEMFYSIPFEIMLKNLNLMSLHMDMLLLQMK